MSVTGAIKFFDTSKSLFKDGSTVQTLTGTTNKELMLNFDRKTKWQSSLAFNQAEYIKLTLDEEKEIDSIFLIGHNFKDYSLSYGITNLLPDEYKDLTNAVWQEVRSTSALSGSQLSPFHNEYMYTLTEDGSTNTHYNSFTSNFDITGGEKLYFSFYVKANGRDRFQFTPDLDASSNMYADFDLENETISYSGATDQISATLEYIFDGIYRVEVEIISQSDDTDCDPIIFMQDGSGNLSYAGDSSSGLFLSHFKLLNYSSESYYSGKNFYNVKTINKGSANKIRETDYSYNSSYYEFAPVETDTIHLVASKGQTDSSKPENLLPSTDYANDYSSIRSDITDNYAYNSKGKKEASFLQEDNTSSATHNMQYPFELGIGDYIYSGEFKQAGRRYIQLFSDLDSSNARVDVDLELGIINDSNNRVTSSSITDLGDGWFKVEYGFSITNYAEVIDYDTRVSLKDGSDSGDTAYNGDDSSGIFFDKLQIRTGNNEYVDTSGSAVRSDRELELGIFCATKIIGTLSRQNIALISPSLDPHEKKKYNIENKASIIKQNETFKCSLSMNHTRIQADIDLFERLRKQHENFLIWLSGGLVGSDFKQVELDGYKLQDLYKVQHQGATRPGYYKDFWKEAGTGQLNLEEAK